ASREPAAELKKCQDRPGQDAARGIEGPPRAVRDGSLNSPKFRCSFLAYRLKPVINHPSIQQRAGRSYLASLSRMAWGSPWGFTSRGKKKWRSHEIRRGLPA